LISEIIHDPFNVNILVAILALPGSKICTQFAHILPFSPFFRSKTVFFQENFKARKNLVKYYFYWVLRVGNEGLDILSSRRAMDKSIASLRSVLSFFTYPSLA
jgi:hypothetical protein